MTKTEKKWAKLEEMTSPAGIAVWPRLDGEPDTKFSEDGHGVYKTTLKLDPKDPKTGEFLEALEQRHRDSASNNAAYNEYCASCKEKGKKPKAMALADPPWKEGTDQDGNADGTVLVNFKMKASGVSKKTGKTWKRKPDIFDSKGQEVTKVLNIGGGSRIKVVFEVNPFWTPLIGAGISLRLCAVQVLSLKTFQKKTAKDYGLGEEDDGFEFSPDEVEDSEGSQKAAPGGKGDDDADGDF